MSPVVLVEDLVKTYPLKGGQRLRALDGVSLSINEGEVLGLLGANGSGKTTTVSILSTLQRPDSGFASVDGHDVVSAAARVRELISLTGQYASLHPTLTVRENIALFGRLTGLRGRAVAARVDEVTETFGLSEFIGRKVADLSGGMRRRADIAAALVTRPRVLFLDEPTTGLDPRSRAAVWEAVSGLRNDGVAVLLTTQYLEEADRLADEIVMLDHGRVALSGTPAQLKARAGEAICEITLLDVADRDRVARALRGRHRITDIAVDSTQSGLAVPAPHGLETLASVLEALRDHEMEVVDVALRRPTLDEVFLALTESRPATEAVS